MPARKSHDRPQATISAFFQPSQRSSSGKRAASPIHIDMSDEDERPAKKARRSETAYQSPEPLALYREGPASQRRFNGASPDKLESSFPPRQRTDAEIAAARERREAFKKKLLLDNNPFLRNRSVQPEPEPESHKAQGADSTDEDSDNAFKELSLMFSNTSKARGKTKKAVPATAAKKVKNPPVLGPSGESYTPLEIQVLQLKSENPGTVLMIEVGYKYKFFGDDAKVAAKELGMVAFTDRNFVVASIPSHRRDIHLKKYEDTKIYVHDIDSVDDLERYSPPPFLCLIEETKPGTTGEVSVGMITICPSTGDVVWDDFEDTLMRIELEFDNSNNMDKDETCSYTTNRVTSTEEWTFCPNYENVKPLYWVGIPHSLTSLVMLTAVVCSTSSSGDKIRIEHFEKAMSYVDAFQLVSDFYTNKTKAAIASENFKSGRLMAEVADFPKRVVIALAHAIQHLSSFSIADAFLETQFFNKFTTKAHMLLAANTLTNLEIYRNETDQSVKGSLLWVLDRTKTKFGARLLRSWIGRPLVDKRQAEPTLVLQDRVDAVEEIIESSSGKLATLRQILHRLPDLAKGLCRIQYGQCTPKELAALLPAFNKIALAFDQVGAPADVGFRSNLLNEIIFSLPKLKEPLKGLMDAVILKKAAEDKKAEMWAEPERYPKITDAEMAIQHVEVELDDQLKAIRKLLKMPSLKWTSVMGDEYLVEVKKSDNRPIPDHWVNHSKTKFYARYQPPVVRQKLEERSQYQETLQAESNAAFSSFLEEIASNHYSILRDAVNKLAIADCLLSLALVALQENYVRPTFTDDDSLEIVDGRHPMVEALRPDPFVANTILMGGSKPRSKIITGPNMGGKSSCVRMIGLIAIMAQIGSYVPAASVKLGLLDSVLTRMGASDDLARGRSTFMVEMSETSEILHSATSKSLVILDELGRGTSTFDGVSDTSLSS
ncbi:hypothetical protein H0H81_005358 [Sphagnurus paluster]|uniref:MutS protein homolog 3 n=1 Tax=Sphagnurus paluster TaxID=117069 RepID=A0A9P7GKL1_9AGAR|nr:hypothetical protein H0H81_005358 [Sphagnurus paluster]